MNKLELFLEIGTEEIPARMVKAAAMDLQKNITAALDAARLSYDKAGARVFWTPRRVAVLFPGLDERQEDLDREVMGPPVRIAVAPDGSPTKAGEGFAKTSGVPFPEIGRKQTPKGEVLCVRAVEKGRAAREILAEAAPAAVASLKFKKSMRWGGYDAAFVRPVRWVLCLLGGEVVPFAYGVVQSGNTTCGLRIHPGAIKVGDFKSWMGALTAQGVIPDADERKKFIRKQVGDLASGAGGHIAPDEALLDEVTNLVECPVPFLGTFDEKYRELPRELLEVTQKHHQRYFPVIAADGKITNHFVGVSNTPVAVQDVVTNGNERVLRARLEDARFFYNEDRKRKLGGYVEKLRGVMFQAKLGSYFDKKERVKKIAAAIVGQVAGFALPPVGNTLAADVERAAELCKADLVTGMVGEFPELQGVMGRYYAMQSGERQEVANAILEHYWPAGASGVLPVSAAGSILAIADKLDTIVGCFHAGLKPTGSADPYALRRAALGIIRIVTFDEGGWKNSFREFPLNIEAATRAATDNFADNDNAAAPLAAEINAFFKARLKAYLGENERADVVDAFLDSRSTITDIYDLKMHFDLFCAFKQEAYFIDFATAYKRAQNITKQTAEDLVPDPALFTEPEEGALYDAWKTVKEAIGIGKAMKSYKMAMESIGPTILPPMNRFFEKVFVEVDDAKVRDNRKALLKQIVMLYTGIADFSRMELKTSKK
ncbi:MAG: glycine--tRNA ligase subunit beta [Myxococcota bacterium]|jgi:glycyl-tRNA synthetase beta chain